MRTGEALVLVAALGGTALAGWHYRADIKARFDKQASAVIQPQAGQGGGGTRPEAGGEPQQPATLYKWVDNNGITHYEQQPGGASSQALQFDGKHLTPVAPPQQQSGGAAAPAPASSVQAPRTSGEVFAGAMAGKGRETLNSIGQHVEEQGQHMRETQESANGL